MRPGKRGTVFVLLLGAAVVAGLVGLSYVLVRLGPELLTNTEGLNAMERDEARGRVRTALFALAAGLIATIGAFYTARTFALNRRGQITERFTRAIDQLGSPNIEVRLGGIYALERIAHESPEERGPIVEVLTAYVRERSPWPPADFREEDGAIVDPSGVDLRDPRYVPPAAAVDIKAIASVLARRPASTFPTLSNRLDLSQTNLTKVSANGIDLRYALLDNAQLYGADLIGAQLQQARLRSASLRRATLITADLSEARLEACDLQRADLRAANLQGANVSGADFRRASANLNTRFPERFDPKGEEVKVRGPTTVTSE